MNRDLPLSRRGFLASSAAAGALAATVPGPASARSGLASPASAAEDRLRRLCRTLAGGAARSAAGAWEAASAESLCRRATGHDLAALDALSDGEILAAIDTETRRTFKAGEVTQVGGWVLSRAEVAVYQLAGV